MKKAAICFTESGKTVIDKINRAAEAAGVRKAEAYIARHGGEVYEGFTAVTEPLSEWAKERFREHAALLFVGAAGIAVRAIAGAVRDKLDDSPVLVIDDLGQFVIPILSGHAGGANRIAVTIAGLIGAVPVITTSTDIHGAFSADTFAREAGLKIRNRGGIKAVSAKAIEGKPVTLSIKNYPPEEPVDIIIADETDREYALLLSPKIYVLGVGMKRDTDPGIAKAFFLDFLQQNGIEPADIYAVATIDLKEEEPAIRSFCDQMRLPLLSFDAALLNRAQGTFTASEFVKKTTGTDNVCESAAVLGAGPGAELLVRKHAGGGITAAVARRNV